ncbi:unnamed protein product [Cyprideis torosa]|uniref:Uncharacterized protein n=1 Tax=Cyprideis torosa TaxID=163714 RepID=A0A7R8WA74_9CRUS|nr:unnamed protein product [Cyprideis torosa]CAG0888079.1 unnamed protein product [Cyprideis torosa]
MACLNVLKQEIKTLEKVFPKNHERFRIVSATVDELTCRFIGKHGRHYDMHANIIETYPQSPPVWFVDSEDPLITSAIEKLSHTSGTDNHILRQVVLLIKDLCQAQSLPEPVDLDTALTISSHANFASSPVICPPLSRTEPMETTEDTDEDEEYDDDDDDLGIEMDDKDSEDKDDDDIDVHHLMFLERLKKDQQNGFLTGSVSGSIQATDRLMKELRDIYRSDSFKSGMYHAELCNDNLYEWRVILKRVDPDSQLHRDLKVLQERDGRDGVEFNFIFGERYPFEPPFVRVVAPVISGGYVLMGGAICMELLTSSGWSSAYTVEAIIMQIAATLVKGKARIEFGSSLGKSGPYSLARAQHSFKSLVYVHDKNGWYTPPKADG